MKFTTTFALILAATGSLIACTDDEDDAPETCSSQMFDKYGRDAFVAVNQKVLENIDLVGKMNPSPIGDSFKGLTPTGIARVEANLLDFLIKVYGGPDNYKGESMEESHEGLNITSEQYDAFVGMIVVPSLQAVGVPADDITNCFAPPMVDPAFKASMVGK
jgi:Bacterial-like globin